MFSALSHRQVALVLITGLSLISACASSEAEEATGESIVSAAESTESSTTSTTVATTSTTVSGPSRYDSVYAMREIFESAGYECSGWEVRPRNDYSIEAADCTSTMVFSLYENASDAMAHALERAEVMGNLLGEDSAFVIGPNWASHCAFEGEQITCDQLADLFGGDVVSFPADP